MPDFIFVTSNKHKVRTAQAICDQFGLKFDHQHMDLQEIQSDSGEPVAKHKVEQAYAKFQQSVAVTDDNFMIPGLNGFPGPYMHYINDWFKPKDFLNLTKDLQDRRIIMRHIIAYKDNETEKLFSVDIPATILKENRGESEITHFTLMSLDGQHSIAEVEANGKTAISEFPNAWHDFCEWFSK